MPAITQYKGQVNVMTVSWMCPASLEPPLLSIALHAACYTHDMLKRSGECVLNIPGRALAEQTWRCGTLSGHDGDKLQRVGLALESAQRIATPRVAGCLANVECALVTTLHPGDHTLFLVQALAAWVEGEAFEGVWRLSPDEELHPLIHLGGKQFCLLGKAVSVA